MRDFAIKDEMTLWIKQLTRHAEAIAELHRVWRCGGHHERQQARNWINNFHKEYLETAIVGIMKLADITLAELAERHENFDDSEYRLISNEPDMP